MALEVEWTQSAVSSLLGVLNHIARDSVSYAAALAVRAERAAASLEQLPSRGRRVPEFDDPDVREIIVGAYRLIYRVRPHKVVILAFVHTARDLSRLASDD